MIVLSSRSERAAKTKLFMSASRIKFFSSKGFKLDDDIELSIDEENSRIRIEATCKLAGRTGVEMEALTAASVAALTIYDMCKAVDRGMEISSVKLLEKQGGKSGHWRSEE